MKAFALAAIACCALAGCAREERVTQFHNTTSGNADVTYQSARDGVTRHVRIAAGRQVTLASIRTFADLARLQVVTADGDMVATARQFAGPLSTCGDRCLIRLLPGHRLSFSIPGAKI